MKKLIATVMACAGLALVAAPVAPAADGNGGRSAAAKECAKMKKADKAAFRATYGKHAMRSCVKGDPVDTAETTPAEFKNAAKACRAERADDPDAFQEKYGANRNKRNAFGKCVSSAVKADEESTS